MWISKSGPIVYVDSKHGKGYAEIIQVLPDLAYGPVVNVRPIGTNAYWTVRLSEVSA